MIRLVDYTLRYGCHIILDDVTASFGSGRVNHLLGRNGTGKSTLAKSLVGLVPHSGTVKGVTSDAVVIGSYSAIPSNLPTGDVIDLARKRSRGGLFETLSSGLGIASIPSKSRLARLSDGQRQRLKLLFFLSGGPATVILDECTDSLDRRSAAEIGDFLNTYLNQPSITSLNITHDVSDLERMPGDYFLLEDGTLTGGYVRAEIMKRYVEG